MHVLYFRATYWLRLCRLLQKEQPQHVVLAVCRSLEVLAMEIFANHGLRSNARLEGA
jgi:hypothetical protein